MQIMIPFEITKEFVSDVLCTALSFGGSSYWIAEIRNLSDNPKSELFSESVAEGDTIEIMDNEDNKKYKLDFNTFAVGYIRYVTYCLQNGKQVFSDPCDIDAEVADTILQFALFDNIVFS